MEKKGLLPKDHHTQVSLTSNGHHAYGTRHNTAGQSQPVMGNSYPQGQVGEGRHKFDEKEDLDSDYQEAGEEEEIDADNNQETISAGPLNGDEMHDYGLYKN